MSKWEVENKLLTDESSILNAATLGFYPLEYKYTVRDKETGERKTATAFNEDHLGEKIKHGSFDRK